MSEVMMKN
uniref:Uncharacterized protein n=1 Tax=Arundo donax TaxID=35708 RepID=A0A0A9EMN1_ARUDO